MVLGPSLSHKVRIVFFAQLRCIFKSFIAEGLQLIGHDETVLQYEPDHGSTARFGPNGLHLQSSVFLSDIEERMDDPDLLTDPMPVEEMFILLGGEVDEHPVISLYALDEQVGQLILPILVDRLVVGSFQGYAMLHALGPNTVNGADQTVKETGNPEMLLPIQQSLFTQGACP